MSHHLSHSTSTWVEKWLDTVVQDKNSMTQRKLTSVNKHGGLAAIKAAAEARGVHLLLIENETGEPLLAASAKPFTVVC